MHNIKHTKLSSIEGLRLAGKGLHSKVKDRNGNEIDNVKKQVYEEKKEVLRTRYREYDRMTNPILLEELTPLWTDANDADRRYRDNVSDLYGRERTFISELWNELTTRNNGRTIICPICEAKPVLEIDHYVPREVMAEYSVHVLNLIPLCHECNHSKHRRWLNHAGKRIFFNAYFDKLPAAPLLKATIMLANGQEYPSVKIEIKNDVDMEIEENRIVVSTIKELHLISNVYQDKADDLMRLKARSILGHCRRYIKCGMTVEDSIKEEFKTEEEIMSDMADSDMLTKLVNEQILQSDVFHNWLVNELTQQE